MEILNEGTLQQIRVANRVDGVSVGAGVVEKGNFIGLTLVIFRVSANL